MRKKEASQDAPAVWWGKMTPPSLGMSSNFHHFSVAYISAQRVPFRTGPLSDRRIRASPVVLETRVSFNQTNPIFYHAHQTPRASPRLRRNGTLYGFLATCLLFLATPLVAAISRPRTINGLAWALDKAYVKAAYRGAAHFRAGWGFNPDDPNDGFLTNLRQRMKELARQPKPNRIDVKWTTEEIIEDGVRQRDGQFDSPVSNLLPESAHCAHIRMILPLNKTADSCPMLVLLPSNGDESYKKRFAGIANKLAVESGIGSVMLEPAFYNRRRAPCSDENKRLRPGQMETVRQLLLTGYTATMETRSLVLWLKNIGHELVGVSGVSLGSFVSCLAASTLNIPLALAACLPCHSAAVCWTDSVMADACDFQKLANDLQDGSTAAVARERCRELLNELTDLTDLPAPAAPNCAVLVSARNDGYIRFASAEKLHSHWEGADLRGHHGGHVSSFVLNQKDFRRACIDALNRLRVHVQSPTLQSNVKSPWLDIAAASKAFSILTCRRAASQRVFSRLLMFASLSPRKQVGVSQCEHAANRKFVESDLFESNGILTATR